MKINEEITRKSKILQVSLLMEGRGDFSPIGGLCGEPRLYFSSADLSNYGLNLKTQKLRIDGTEKREIFYSSRKIYKK